MTFISRFCCFRFRFSGNTASGWLDVVHGAAIYSKMHGRVLDVPSNFVVPSLPEGNLLDSGDAWPWPEHLKGLKLGQRLKDVRLKGTYLKGKDKHIRKVSNQRSRSPDISAVLFHLSLFLRPSWMHLVLFGAPIKEEEGEGDVG